LIDRDKERDITWTDGSATFYDRHSNATHWTHMPSERRSATASPTPSSATIILSIDEQLHDVDSLASDTGFRAPHDVLSAPSDDACIQNTVHVQLHEDISCYMMYARGCIPLSNGAVTRLKPPPRRLKKDTCRHLKIHVQHAIIFTGSGIRCRRQPACP